MKLENTYLFFKEMLDDTLSFIYQGHFDDAITDMMIDLSEFYITNSKFSKVRKKVSFLMVECFQNIIRHGDNSDVQIEDMPPGLFMTRNIRDRHYIVSANLIDNKSIPSLRQKLDSVNTASPEELKQLYFEVLDSEGFSSKGGAGLGLIQMARKSKQKLDFDFVKVNDQVSYFYLQLKMKSDEQSKQQELQLDNSKRIHSRTIDEDIFLIHKGNFTQAAIRPVIKMVENNMQLKDKGMNLQKSAFHIMVEVLQNISKHSYEDQGMHEGIFLMGYEDDKYVLSTGNYIDNNKIDALKDSLEQLNELNNAELKSMYKKLLREGRISDKGCAGLGLIDISREISDKLEYEFIPIDDKKSFYSLLIKL